jgi:SAM-dependent methyltransferase
MTELYQTAERMGAKLEAIPIPDLTGKSVLDIGCDTGFWSFLAKERGAARVLGLDRNREVGGAHTDLIALNRAMARDLAIDCAFEKLDLGKQWHEFGRFDVVFMFSLYHHVYQNCGDHATVWYWLWRHVKPDGLVLWENPVDTQDAVVRMNVSPELQYRYTERDILEAASRYFEFTHIGPAKHEPHREVYAFKPCAYSRVYDGRLVSGAGGATRAFNYAGSRRCVEIDRLLGFYPYPGSINLELQGDFDWESGYYRSQILDVLDRRAGLNSEWVPRWCRFAPVELSGHAAFAMRFEGERYPLNFVEVISHARLRDTLRGDRVALCITKNQT